MTHQEDFAALCQADSWRNRTEQKETKQTAVLTNTEILIFILGKQGGTVHQVAETLGVTASEIINANYDKMQDLARAAQVRRTQELYNIFNCLDDTINPIAAIRRKAIVERDEKEERQ